MQIFCYKSITYCKNFKDVATTFTIINAIVEKKVAKTMPGTTITKVPGTQMIIVNSIIPVFRMDAKCVLFIIQVRVIAGKIVITIKLTVIRNKIGTSSPSL